MYLSKAQVMQWEAMGKSSDRGEWALNVKKFDSKSVESILDETEFIGSTVSNDDHGKVFEGLHGYIRNYFRKRQLFGKSLLDGLQAVLEREYHDEVQNYSTLDNPDTRAKLAAFRSILLELYHLFQEARQESSILHISAKTRKLLFKAVEEFLHSKVGALNLRPHSQVKTAEAISIIEDTLSLIEKLFRDIDVSEVWQADLDQLVTHYIENGIKVCFEDLHRTILTKDSFLQDNSGDQKEYRTNTLPTDATAIIDGQVALARIALPYKYIRIVVCACNQEMSKLLSSLSAYIERSAKRIGTEIFCALINDIYMLRELVHKRNQKYLTHPSFKKKADNFDYEYEQLLKRSTKLLARRLLKELVASDRKVLQIGTEAWAFDGSREITYGIIVYFKSHLMTLEPRLGSCFPRLLKALFDQLLQVYFEAFFTNTLNKATNPFDVCQAIEDDYAMFLGFFNGDAFDDYYGQERFYLLTELNLRLHLLKSLANVVHPLHKADELKPDVRALLHAFEPTYKRFLAILHVAGFHDHANAIPWSEWAEMIGEASEELDTTCLFEEPLVLPSLRHSKYFAQLSNEEKTICGLLAPSSVDGQDSEVHQAAPRIRVLKCPPVVLRAQSDTVSVV